jgi:hypothetical protein
MDFVRQGMRGAQPRFSDRNGEPRGGLMHKADNLDLTAHPDAMLIADAPALLDALEAFVSACENEDVGDLVDAETTARALLRKHGRLS